ncbi:MAG: ATP-binding protein [Gammaproteobacteria bacterium]|nr:MAG: ATP-binding protein [Gammaproteobacteria bacterium]
MTADVQRLTLRHLGPIVEADVAFGDLTVLVGPQATGKSIFLQMFKLAVDTASIHRTFARHDIDWGGKLEGLFEIYFGEGMSSIYRRQRSQILLNGKPLTAEGLAERQIKEDALERVFYIPAQRVLSMRDGITHPFTDYRAGDPFCLREFSEKLHVLVQSEFISGRFFPKINRLKQCLRDLVKKNIYGKLSLIKHTSGYQKRIVLETQDKAHLPYLVWSAGQREFTPLLLGCYWLLPPSRTPRRQALQWAILEEPEMGLHPSAISATLALVLELLARGYRVCLSTHSPQVLDVVWALRFLQSHGGKKEDVKAMLDLKGQGADTIAKASLEKSYHTYFFPPYEPVVDISSLDPAAVEPEISGWGGLTGFSGHIGEIVARVARRYGEHAA